ncbi:MAG: CotH kinase family protein [Clostridia bacterium]|nr:CotH kinase family protein [Clostridia bacterium]
MADNEVMNLQEPDEEYSPIDVKDLDKDRVKLGRQGENETQTVQIDCNDWLVALQGCTFMVVAMRPGERELYVPDVTVSVSGLITWPITAQDTACAGAGRAEVRAIKGGAVKKSKLFRTWIEPALDGEINDTPTVPPNWVKGTLENLERANALMADALAAATAASDAAASLGDEVDAYKADALGAIADAKADAMEQAASDVQDIEAARDLAQDAISAAQAAAVAAAGEAMDEQKAQALEAAEAALEAAKDAKLEEIAEASTNAEQMAASAVIIAQSANTLSAQAVEASVNAENDAAEAATKAETNAGNIQTLQLQILDRINGGFVDEETGKGYFTADGRVIFEMVGMGGGSGGGGGGGSDSGNNAHISMTNTSGWMSKTIAADGDTCPVSFHWTSLENDLPTGNGSLTVRVNGVLKATLEVQQGDVTVDVAGYVGTGSNIVSLTVNDIYQNNRTINMTVTVVEISLSSSFDASTPYTGAIPFPYTPVGSVTKTVHFILDGTEIGTQTTSVSGRQQSFTIPQQPHGAHTFRVYFEAAINGQTVRSNELYYEMICIDPLSTVPIIVSPFNSATAVQYATLNIPFTVYDPMALTAAVTIEVNGTQVSAQTVDRTEHTFAWRAEDAGALTVTIKSGTATKTISVTVSESDIQVEAETQNLALHLNTVGRSNNEAHPEAWTDADNHISATLTDFNFKSDGWQLDETGVTVLRVAGDARVTIPYQIFATDFRTSGKTVEVEFATRDVTDYDAVILSCLSGGRGLNMTAQLATLTSEQSRIDMQYKEGEHVRIGFVVEKRSEHRLIFVYVNGIMSGVVQYPASDDFQQTTPVGISIGSNSCTVDLYRIRVYDNDLTRHQMLDNWIADSQNVDDLIERYNRNNVYDAYGNIVIANLPGSLPYMIIQCAELPQYKGDKKTCTVTYVDPVTPSKSFTAENVQIDVQGTSSQYYARKNYKMKYKGGFLLNNGTRASKYALRAASIPTNTFCMKADVASSEGANNVELAILYNDACPFKTPPQVENDAVRQGIDGFPCVIFWSDGTATTFLGKYNFNNDKGTEEVFGFEDGDESWEIRNNTSDRVLWKSDDYSGSGWLNDFEARYPDTDPVYEDATRLQALAAWLKSTDRTAATGDALAESYTDADGTVHTTDNTAYRLAKFRTEAAQHLELQSAMFYYIFTELFLMVDSRAKNAFPTLMGAGKWCWLPYDFDTALGINNEGALVFGYSLEDTDTLTGGADVFNGQQSVMWCNLRDAFAGEIKAMYQTLRSTGVLSYGRVEAAFEAHQDKWGEAIFNEDAWFKYLAPLIEDGSGAYLAMLQGSKAEQRKWWLYNRFRYMDSKYNAGDALSDVIQLRGYAKADVTVTPYADVYASVKYGSYLMQTRGTRNTAYTLVCPLDNVNDTEIYIYSASQLASVGDLSGLKVGFADFSMATKLSSIKLGDSGAGYDNGNLKELYLGNNTLLRTLDVRGCSGLGTGDMKSVDIHGCVSIENVYFDGTAITGVELPNGGQLRVLHLPATITNLTIRNQTAITDLTVPSYANITTLWLENVSAAVDMLTILNAIPAASRVRLIGVAWEATTAAEILAIIEKLNTMRGLDESGNNMDTAQVQGTIHISALTGAELATILEAKEDYPYLDVIADHTSSTLTYKSYDGSSTLKTVSCIDGVPQESAPSGPSRASTAQYSYAFVGWNREMDAQTAQADAATNVMEDRTIYAAYSRTVRTYSITWKNADNTTLRTDTLAYGATPSWGQAMPTYNGQTAQGWTPTISTVTGNATYTASYIPTYTATFVRAAEDGGGTLYTQQNVQQGTTPTYGGETPTSTREGYTFNGWTPALSGIQANTTYTAKFKAPSDAPTATTADGAYGVEWDYSGSGTTLTRKGLAASFANPAPATDLASSGSSPFDSIQPWAGMKRYNVVNGSLVPDTDPSFDESANDTVVYIPEFYYTAYKDTANSKWLWAISPTAKEGYKKHPGSGVYVGRFHTSGDSSAVFSKGGVAPLGNVTRANFRTYSAAKGTGWRQMDLKVWSAIQMLYLVEFADWHSQDTLGTGHNTGSVTNTGGTTGAAYHTVKRSGATNAYRWIENPFSNVYTWVDGFVASSKAAYVGTDPASYGDTTSGLEAAGITLPSSEFITGLGYSEKCAWAFIPDTASGGSATTKIPDKVYSNSGTCVLYVGGNWDANGYFGLFYFSANSRASDAYASLGSRLLYQP